MAKRILFITPYPYNNAPSQRFRFEQYLEVLKEAGIEYELKPFLSKKAWGVVYKKGNFWRKSYYILKGIIKRMVLLFSIGKYHYVFIHRESSPVGPPFFEWILSKLLKKKFIYDFDDAIWLPNYRQENKLWNHLKNYSKISKIIAYADKIVAGNDFLKRYAEQFNSNVVLIPTTIDTEKVHNILTNHEVEKVKIGWTGSHTTIKYLDDMIPVLRELEKEREFEFIVISNQKPDFKLKSFRFVPWNIETEIKDLSQIQIGIMPLLDTNWARGKCGFKALQYMALGIPAVASPVGVNLKIIKNGENGFLCSNHQEWKEKLTRLLDDSELRKRMGEKGRAFIEANYSVQSQKKQFLDLFK